MRQRSYASLLINPAGALTQKLVDAYSSPPPITPKVLRKLRVVRGRIGAIAPRKVTDSYVSTLLNPEHEALKVVGFRKAQEIGMVLWLTSGFEHCDLLPGRGCCLGENLTEPIR